MFVRLSVCALLAIPLTAAAQQSVLPFVSSVVENASQTQLTISGTGFGKVKPAVTLSGGAPIRVVSFSDTSIVVNLPAGTPSGSYLLTVVNGNTHIPGLFIADVGPTQGAAGPAGPMGAPGPAGPTGPMGTPGAIGAAGPVGPAGTAGPAGATGPAGPAGANGTTGPAGPTGPTGAPGANGPAGSAGPIGAPGANGPAGPAGPIGAAGANGAAGPAGPIGAPGANGPAGPAGPVGATGSIGPAGAAGPAGAPGATGPQGPAGVPGTAGAQGPPGANGLTGPAGPTGPTGATGAAGAAGATGAQGPEGEAGPAGPAGAQGPTGPSTQLWASNTLLPAKLVSNSFLVSPPIGAGTAVDENQGGSVVSEALPVPTACTASNFQVEVINAQGSSSATVYLGHSTESQLAANDVYSELYCTTVSNNGNQVSCSQGADTENLSAGSFISILVTGFTNASDYQNASVLVNFTCQ